MTPIRYSPRTGTMAEDPQGDYIEYPSWRPIATAPTRRRVLESRPALDHRHVHCRIGSSESCT